MEESGPRDLAAPESPHSPRLLLVEDDSIIALAESRMLERNGYEVVIARSGEAALELMEGGSSPDLILMDIDLGSGMDGTQTAKTILQRWDLPIVFLTSHSSREMVEKVRGITRYGYVLKHSGAFVIQTSIEMAFELFHKERQVREKNLLLERAERIARIGYWSVDVERKDFILSERSQELAGVDQERIPIAELETLVTHETSNHRHEAFSALLERGDPYDVSYRFRRRDNGRELTVRSSARMFGDQVLGIIQDISDMAPLIEGLRSCEDLQSITLRSIGDGVIVTDPEGGVLEMNPSAETLTGWRTEEAWHRPIQDVFHIINANTRERVENPVRRVMESGTVVGLANHTILVARDGVERHIADSAAPIRDEGGTILGMVLVFRDVSQDYQDQSALAQSLQFFKTIFVDAHTPMVLVDPETGRIENANKAAESFYGWPLETLCRMTSFQINTLPQESLAALMRETLTAGRREYRFTHRFSDGSEGPVFVLCGPVMIDGKTLLLSIINRWTDR